MTVYVLIREDQNEHGYVDTSIAGVFLERQSLALREAVERRDAAGEGLLIEGQGCPDGEWQVSWKVEEHVVMR